MREKQGDFMAKAKKLPSGRYRALVYVGKDSDGKRKYESFTADTRREAEFMAAEYMNSKTVRRASNITVKEAMDRYIASKENVLSPSTIAGYKRTAKNTLLSLHLIKLNDLTQELIQNAINLESQLHSAKYVKNAHGLLSSALKMFLPGFNLNTSLPKVNIKAVKVPINADIICLLKHIKNTEIEIPVLLAAVGSLRKCEISPLEDTDVLSNGIVVNKSMVLDSNNQWQIRHMAKTNAGNRFSPLPEQVLIKLRNKKGRIVNLNPNQIYSQYKKALKKCNLPNYSFHSLRKYYASILHAIGVPDKYIMQYGGWASNIVLKKVYQQVLPDKDIEEQNIIVNHFSRIIE